MRLLVLAAALAVLGSAAPPDVRSTKHNLSARSANKVRAQHDEEVCVFCHTPHGAYASRPAWNKDLGYQTKNLYTLYSSSTLDAAVPRPTGASKMCLSCHDGTIGLGSLMNLAATRGANASMSGGASHMPDGPGRLGTDLRNDHPISIVPNLSDPEISLPPPGDPVRLQDGEVAGARDSVQCTTCHDPHLRTPAFLVRDTNRGALCTTCHTKTGWTGSMHEASLAPYPAGQNATTVRDFACLSCHAPHNGSSPSKLLHTQNRGGAPMRWSEENVCLQCHRAGGTGTDPARNRAAPDLQTDLATKTSRHPLSLKVDEHEPVFTGKNPSPEPVQLDVRHVECVDCHNPHQVRALPGNVHEGMKGIDLNGNVVTDDASTDVKQYEICLRCHGDTFATFIPAASTRPPSGSNKRLEFQPTNGAFHPVAGPGRNQSPHLNNVNDPSNPGQLKGLDWQGRPMSRLSTVLCTDCHNNEATADTAGSARQSNAGPKGPHASGHSRLLRATYSTAIGTMVAAPFATYSATNFALCFLCHDESRLLGSATNFTQESVEGRNAGNLHLLHLDRRSPNGRTNASCHECHYNVHSNTAGANTEFAGLVAGEPTHLVSFAPNVQPFPGKDPNNGGTPAKPRWGRRPGTNDYYCLASCHGKAGMDGERSVYRPTKP